MKQSTELEINKEEKVDNYLSQWGSDKKSFVDILRQLIFILGIVSTVFVGVWVIIHAISFYLSNDDFLTLTNRLAKVSIAFIAFIIMLDSMYLGAEFFSYNKNRRNRIPSMVMGGFTLVTLIVFFILTCVELFGFHNASRSYIYCIYLVICFSCCLFSTIYCFDARQKNLKFNPNNKLLKSLAYTTGFLGIFAVVTYMLWIMWYATGNEALAWTCFILARTIITLIGSIIVMLVCQIGLIIVMKHKSTRKKSRIIYLSILFAVMFGLEFFLGYLFLLDGLWTSNVSLCKAMVTITVIIVIAVSAIDIAIASRYATHLEKEAK